jgi:hypothetical protein
MKIIKEERMPEIFPVDGNETKEACELISKSYDIKLN